MQVAHAALDLVELGGVDDGTPVGCTRRFSQGLEGLGDELADRLCPGPPASRISLEVSALPAFAEDFSL
ncbi:MAG: hypothetical protein ACLSVD_02510 [Eggerthellaceae bacterium]